MTGDHLLLLAVSREVEPSDLPTDPSLSSSITVPCRLQPQYAENVLLCFLTRQNDRDWEVIISRHFKVVLLEAVISKNTALVSGEAFAAAL